MKTIICAVLLLSALTAQAARLVTSVSCAGYSYTGDSTYAACGSVSAGVFDNAVFARSDAPLATSEPISESASVLYEDAILFSGVTGPIAVTIVRFGDQGGGGTFGNGANNLTYTVVMDAGDPLPIVMSAVANAFYTPDVIHENGGITHAVADFSSGFMILQSLMVADLEGNLLNGVYYRFESVHLGINETNARLGVAPTPEPGTLLLSGVAMAGLAALRHRKKKPAFGLMTFPSHGPQLSSGERSASTAVRLEATLVAGPQRRLPHIMIPRYEEHPLSARPAGL